MYKKIILTIFLIMLALAACDGEDEAIDVRNSAIEVEIIGNGITVIPLESEENNSNWQENIEENVGSASLESEDATPDEDNASMQDENAELVDSDMTLPDEADAEEESDIEEGNKVKHDEPVDLIFFMGQSNMAGYGGDAALAPKVEADAGEEYRVVSAPDRLYEISEPFGKREANPSGLKDDMSKWKGSLVSSFINSYYDATHHKVIAVSISCGGMAMDLWLGDHILNDCKERVAQSFAYLTDHGYSINRSMIVWLQGESDAMRQVEPSLYRGQFDSFMSQLLALGIDKVCIITPGRTHSDPESYKSIIDLQKKMCEENDNYILATDLLNSFDVSLMSDEYHYGQEALNQIGVFAAKGIANKWGNY